MTRVCPHSDTKCPHGMTCKYSCAIGEYDGTKTMTLTPQEIADGWQEWTGGPTPEGRGQRRTRSYEGPVRSFDDDDWGSDIIAYRLAGTEEVLSGGKCPRCQSPDPARHPAVQFGGECTICPHPFHTPPPEPNTSAEPVGDGGMREAVVTIEMLDAALTACDDNFRTVASDTVEIILKAALAAAPARQDTPVGAALRPAQAPEVEGLEIVAWGVHESDGKWTSYPTPDGYLADFNPTVAVEPLTDHATATRLLAEKDARIAELETKERSNWDEFLAERSARMDANTREYAATTRALVAEAEVTRWQSAYNAANDTAVILGDQAVKAEAGKMRLRQALMDMVEHFERVDASEADKIAIKDACAVWASFANILTPRHPSPSRRTGG